MTENKKRGKNMANPLKKEDKAKINAALAAIAEVKKDILKAKSAGIDVSNQETRLLETEERLKRLKSVYFVGIQ